MELFHREIGRFLWTGNALPEVLSRSVAFLQTGPPLRPDYRHQVLQRHALPSIHRPRTSTEGTANSRADFEPSALCELVPVLEVWSDANDGGLSTRTELCGGGGEPKAQHRILLHDQGTLLGGSNRVGGNRSAVNQLPFPEEED